VVTGSGAAFLVLESREHAEARGRHAYARLEKVASGRGKRDGEALEEAIAQTLAETLAPAGDLLVFSGASGADRATAAEKAAFGKQPGAALRAFSTLTGHLKEAQFPFAIALAALALDREEAIAPLDAENEAPFAGAPSAALATAVGYHQFEGMALLAPA
jgi:3-oxoacyl-[acyl-carrier-protein] synthase II